jgi:hypothetical protein
MTGAMRVVLPALAATALLAAGCATAPQSGGTPGGPPKASCTIVGGPKAPAEVRIYESNPYGAPAGRRIYIGLLNKGEQHVIETPTGRIWYAYRWHEGDSWKEGFESPCQAGQTIPLPP